MTEFFQLAVRGLGDLACCSDSVLSKFSADAIQAAMAGLDDSGDRRDEVLLLSQVKVNDFCRMIQVIASVAVSVVISFWTSNK